MTRVSVLTYHAISETPSVLSVSPGQFRAHMEAIVRSGRKVIPASRLVRRFDEEPRIEDGSFVITFDDGYGSVGEHAAPVLEELRFPYALFLVTRWVGLENGWPSQPSWVPRARLLGWGEIERLASRGAEIGAHTADHVPLAGAAESVVRQQVDESAQAIERRLLVVPRLFAYPEGRADPAAREIARSRFPACFVTRHARAGDAGDRAEIPRIETFYFRDPARFARLFSSAIDARLTARRALRSLRRLV